MPNLLDRFATTWRDAGRDVVLIVVSIMIAFALDAWWDGLGERRAQSEQIAALRSEFVTARGSLASQAEALDAAGQATVDLLGLMGPQAPSPDPDTVHSLLQRSFNVGLRVPRQTVLDRALASSNRLIVANDSLAPMLSSWSGPIEELVVDGEHLERNRDVDLQAALVEIGLPGIASAAAGSPLGLPPSHFPTDTDRIVRSVRVYAGLYYRALRFRVLSGSISVVLETADAIIEQLDEISDPDTG